MENVVVKTASQVLELALIHNWRSKRKPGPVTAEDAVVELLAEILIQLAAIREGIAGVPAALHETIGAAPGSMRESVAQLAALHESLNPSPRGVAREPAARRITDEQTEQRIIDAPGPVREAILDAPAALRESSSLPAERVGVGVVQASPAVVAPLPGPTIAVTTATHE